DWADLHAERRRQGLDGGELANRGRLGRIANNRRPSDARHDLLEQFQPFPTNAELKLGKSGDVAARLRQAGYQATVDGISCFQEHDWDRAGQLLQYASRRAAAHKQYVGGNVDQFLRVLVIEPRIVCGPAILDLQVATRCPAPFPKSIDESRNLLGRLRV